MRTSVGRAHGSQSVAKVPAGWGAIPASWCLTSHLPIAGWREPPAGTTRSGQRAHLPLTRQTEGVDNQADEDETRDRRALEAIIGRGLDNDGWPADALPPGTRVRVIQDQEWGGPWREVFLATIDRTLPPQMVNNGAAHSGEREYSVTFDEPHLDASGDGPYRKAGIWDRYLERL